MDLERAERQAALTTAEREFEELEMTADGLQLEVRRLTDPTLHGALEVDIKKLTDLTALWGRYAGRAMDLRRRIAKLREALGLPARGA